MEEPKFMKEGYSYIGEDEQWHIKNNSPEWVKKEFKEFFKMVDPEPDKDGKITRYENTLQI
ncbi:hypothetical protein A500_10520 [Clostridium sartagoforme AAU1]|uniref:Uncharacterized protein n=1 Tax=Clostridium sartagoforme AAU1 TaxID=1202534 RepID=R9C7G4_9CLOT|nr:hypothetical protein [Clostridium sartagoforme]EOR25304.1 hypothetical protein A500_10520 [Clostridium sartagoforme AAU1]